MKIFNLQFSIFKNKKGFTLIEILIASYIFVVVILTGTAIFSSTVGAKMKATSFWQTQQDARYIMEKISREIRDNKVKGFSVPSLNRDVLNLCGEINSDGSCKGTPIHTIKKSGDNILLDNNILNSTNTKITQLEFSPYYFPSSDSVIQPYITIKITIQNLEGNRKIDTDTLTLQTTISFRNYDYKYEY